MKGLFNKLKENKGIILAACGVGVALAGIVAANKASLKCADIAIEHEANKNVIEECAAKNLEEYTEADRLNDHKINNVQTTIKIVRVCVVPYLTIISGGCIIVNGGFKIYEKYKRSVNND